MEVCCRLMPLGVQGCSAHATLQVPETVDEEPEAAPPQTKQEGKFF